MKTPQTSHHHISLLSGFAAAAFSALCPSEQALYNETLTRNSWRCACKYVHVCMSMPLSPRFHLEQVFHYILFQKSP